MAIIRLYTGADGKSHFEEIEPVFERREARPDVLYHLGIRVQIGGIRVGRPVQQRDFGPP